MLQRITEKITATVVSSYSDEEHRKTVVFNLLNVLLSGVALVMTVVNFRTQEWLLMYVTAAFSALCLANFVLVNWNLAAVRHVHTAFSIEVMVLLVWFVLSGTPNGFSVLWTLLVPALTLYIFGMKMGTQFCVLTFCMIVFFFWCPFGRSLLYYEYSPTFMLRFPFVYLCLFLASFYIETIRIGVHTQMIKAEENARYLYRHDALTGLYSRYAFSEEIRRIFRESSQRKTAIIVFDIDNFKQINDRHGHNAGDQVLQTVAGIIREYTCEHCICCRWGGEEFLVLMQCDHDPLQTAEKIRSIAAQTVITHEEVSLRVTLSAGIAVADSLENGQLSSFINCADNAMYASKAAGKNTTTFTRFTG